MEREGYSVTHDQSCALGVGARYNLFCANLARTYLVDPSKTQQEEYAALLAAAEAATKALVPGAPCSDAFAAAVKALEVWAVCGTLDCLCAY